MTNSLHGTYRQYRKLTVSQDLIGWRRFMEGVISKEILVIHQEYLDLRGSCGNPTIPKSWSKGLIICQIEIIQGQWLYQNVHVHDTVPGLHATHRKEELKKEIKDQIQMGGDRLVEDGKYLLEINFKDMETTSGERQEYWLLAKQAARETRILRDSEINVSESEKSD